MGCLHGHEGQSWWHAIKLSNLQWHAKQSWWHVVKLSTPQWHAIKLSNLQWHAKQSWWHVVKLSNYQWHAIKLFKHQWCEMLNMAMRDKVDDIAIKLFNLQWHAIKLSNLQRCAMPSMAMRDKGLMSSCKTVQPSVICGQKWRRGTKQTPSFTTVQQSIIWDVRHCRTGQSWWHPLKLSNLQWSEMSDIASRDKTDDIL